jgi:DNA polymerase (family 10)
VDVLGHPSGRIIGHRGPVRLDWDRVYSAAAQRGARLEVNAQPHRLDLDDLQVRAALGHGVTLAISTDSHAVAELGFMRWGVDQARRGWAPAEQVANTLPLARLLKRLHHTRR